MPCAGCARRRAALKRVAQGAVAAVDRWVRAPQFGGPMELTAPVVRRKAGDPLVYLFAAQADGWAKHGLAFKTIDDLIRSGWVVGAWTTDAHGDLAPLTRP